jgi:hypothetical protein
MLSLLLQRVVENGESDKIWVVSSIVADLIFGNTDPTSQRRRRGFERSWVDVILDALNQPQFGTTINWESIQTLLLPLNLSSNHWALVALDLSSGKQTRLVTVYDSWKSKLPDVQAEHQVLLDAVLSRCNSLFNLDTSRRLGRQRVFERVFVTCASPQINTIDCALGLLDHAWALCVTDWSSTEETTRLRITRRRVLHQLMLGQLYKRVA